MLQPVAKAETYRLSRTSVPALDAHLGIPYQVLDHGFVRCVDYLGSDQSIVQAARVSYGDGTKHTSNDRGLIRYLMRHWHTTPFEMCEIKLHMKLPIFVARQMVRHRTASINEYSARYSLLSGDFYVPELDKIAKQSEVNNQGRGAVLDKDAAHRVREGMMAVGEDAFAVYNHFNEEEVGLARELSRTVLPVSTYTEWYWKIDLHNLFHFLRLRADPHAQYEVRVYAEVICELVKDWVPVAYEAFEDYRRNAVSLSAQQRAYVRGILRHDHLPPEHYGLTAREAQEVEDWLSCS